MGAPAKSYVIQKNVTRQLAAPPPKTIPWASMEVGDALQFDKFANAKSSAKRASEKYAPKVFTAGVASNGNFYIWRDA